MSPVSGEINGEGDSKGGSEKKIKHVEQGKAKMERG